MNIVKLSVCAGVWRSGVPWTPLLCKSWVLLVGVGSAHAPMPKEVGSLSSPEKVNNKGLFGAH